MGGYGGFLVVFYGFWWFYNDFSSRNEVKSYYFVSQLVKQNNGLLSTVKVGWSFFLVVVVFFGGF